MITREPHGPWRGSQPQQEVTGKAGLPDFCAGAYRHAAAKFMARSTSTDKRPAQLGCESPVTHDLRRILSALNEVLQRCCQPFIVAATSPPATNTSRTRRHTATECFRAPSIAGQAHAGGKSFGLLPAHRRSPPGLRTSFLPGAHHNYGCRRTPPIVPSCSRSQRNKHRHVSSEVHP